MERPRITVVIPVKNGERFLVEAIDSIKRQSLDALEIVVVDDGSTDGTRRLIEEKHPDCRYVHQETAGPAAARNAGVEISRGELIGFLDADDLFTRRGLSVLHAALSRSTRAEIAMGTVQPIHARPGGEAAGFEPFGDPVVCYNVGCILVRREVFDRVGVFDPGYGQCEDVDWFMRAQEHGTAFEILDETVLFYRRHENNMSRDAAATSFYLAKVLKASLDRRRRLPSGAESPQDLDRIYYVRPGRLRM